MPTTTIRVREPRELLSLIPHQLGFHPRESAVVVSLREPRGRVGLVARVDLADLGDRDSGPQLARTLVTHLVNDGAGRAVLVVYTDQGAHAARSTDGTVRTAAAQVVDAADRRLREVTTWVVGPHGYFGLDCVDDGCCPGEGRPLSDLESTTVAAHFVLAGSAVAECRDSLARISRAGAAARRSAAAARTRAERSRQLAEESGPGAVAVWREGVVALWRSEVGRARGGDRDVHPPRLGRLEIGLRDVVVRDAVLVTLVPGTGDLAERCARGAGDTQDGAIGRAVAMIVDPQVGVPPLDDVTAHDGVLEAVVAHGTAAGQAPALTLLALLAWWRADGARAAVLVERALTEDGSHRLALLLRQAIDAGLPPGWVRRPS